MPRQFLVLQLFMLLCVLFLSARVAWRSWPAIKDWNDKRLQLGGAPVPWVHFGIAAIGALCFAGGIVAGVVLVLRFGR